MVLVGPQEQRQVMSIFDRVDLLQKPLNGTQTQGIDFVGVHERLIESGHLLLIWTQSCMGLGESLDQTFEPLVGQVPELNECTVRGLVVWNHGVFDPLSVHEQIQIVLCTNAGVSPL